MQKGIKTLVYLYFLELGISNDPTAEMQKGIKTLLSRAYILCPFFHDPTAEMQKGIKTVSVGFNPLTPIK